MYVYSCVASKKKTKAGSACVLVFFCFAFKNERPARPLDVKCAYSTPRKIFSIICDDSDRIPISSLELALRAIFLLLEAARRLCSARPALLLSHSQKKKHYCVYRHIPPPWPSLSPLARLSQGRSEKRGGEERPAAAGGFLVSFSY